MTVSTKLTVGATVISDTTNMTLSKTISDNNATSRLEWDIPNWVGFHKTDFTVGATVSLNADLNTSPAVTTIFGGVITETSFDGSGSNKETMHVIARDYTSLLQKNTVDPEVYTNAEISTIVTNLMGKYAPLTFTTTNVQVTSVTLSRMTFKRVNLFDALKQLAELAGGWFFYVDENQDLHFSPKNTVSSGLTFDNTNTTKTTFTTDVETVKNRVFVYGNRQLVQVPQESFTGTGTGSVFTLQYSPSNTKVQVSGSTKKGDILNNAVNIASGIDYLVSYNDKQIVFVSGTSIGYSAIPGSLVQVLVDYSRSTPIVKLAEDYTSIAAYGKRTLEIIDENIVDPTVAINIARNQILLKKDPKTQGMITVKGIVAVMPGETCVINFPYENQSTTTVNILEARYNFNTINNFSDQVLQIKVSQRIADVTDVLKDLILNVQRLQAGQVDTSALQTRLLSSVGSAGIQVPLWYVKTRTIGQTHILGHPINGKLGSPQLAVNGSQITLGDYRSAFTIIASGVT